MYTIVAMTVFMFSFYVMYSAFVYFAYIYWRTKEWWSSPRHRRPTAVHVKS